MGFWRSQAESATGVSFYGVGSLRLTQGMPARVFWLFGQKVVKTYVFLHISWNLENTSPPFFFFWKCFFLKKHFLSECKRDNDVIGGSETPGAWGPGEFSLEIHQILQWGREDGRTKPKCIDFD